MFIMVGILIMILIENIYHHYHKRQLLVIMQFSIWKICSGHADASTIGADTYSNASQAITLTLSAQAQRKYLLVPFQGGFDGDNPN